MRKKIARNGRIVYPVSPRGGPRIVTPMGSVRGRDEDSMVPNYAFAWRVDPIRGRP